METVLIIRLFAVIGLLDTLYLIYHRVRGTDVACIGFPREWCRRVQYSRQASTFGIPNSVAGFVMYALIFLLTTVSGVPAWPLQLLVLSGFAFSLYFMYVQVAVLRALCTWCVISFINFTVMAWALFIR